MMATKSWLPKAATSFQKFGNAERNCLYDVIDVPGVGVDASIRPNQILPFLFRDTAHQRAAESGSGCVLPAIPHVLWSAQSRAG